MLRRILGVAVKGVEAFLGSTKLQIVYCFLAVSILFTALWAHSPQQIPVVIYKLSCWRRLAALQVAAFGLPLCLMPTPLVTWRRTGAATRTPTSMAGPTLKSPRAMRPFFCTCLFQHGPGTLCWACWP